MGVGSYGGGVYYIPELQAVRATVGLNKKASRSGRLFIV
jgi:hypothetical protein